MKRIEIVFLSVLFLLYLFWFAIPVSVVGTENSPMIDAFNVDESEYVHYLNAEIKQKSFNVRSYVYGHLYYNSGLLPLCILDFFYPVSEKTIIIFFRLLSSLYFIGIITIVFFISLKFFGKITAWLSTLLLLTTSSHLFVYSTMLHPDIAQVFFISLGLYFCMNYFEVKEEDKWKTLAFASILAGFAFGTKYAGILLLPIVFGIDFFYQGERHRISSLKLWFSLFICAFAVVILHQPWVLKYVPLNPNSEFFFRLVFPARILSALAAIVFLWALISPKNFSGFKYSGFVLEKTSNLVLFSSLFFIAFALSSPGGVRGLNFIQGFVSVTDAARHGHWFRESQGFSGWINILLTKGVIILPVFLLFVFGVLFMIIEKFKRKGGRFFPQFILLAWIAIYLVVLVTSVNAGFAHYLIPLMPFIIILGANMFEITVKFLSKKIPRPDLIYILVIAAIIVFGYPVFYSLKDIIETRENYVNKVSNSISVRAGIWLEENYPEGTRILFDRYVYIPPKFQSAFSSWGIDKSQVFETKPDLIIINSKIYLNFLDPQRAEYFLAGSNQYLEKNSFYKNLLGGNSGLEMVKDFGEIKIFSVK